MSQGRAAEQAVVHQPPQPLPIPHLAPHAHPVLERQQVVEDALPASPQAHRFEGAERVAPPGADRRDGARRGEEHPPDAMLPRGGVIREPAERQGRQERRVRARHPHVRLALLPLPRERPIERRHVVVPPAGSFREPHVHAARDQPHAQLVVLVAAQPLVEAARLEERPRRQRAVAGEDVAVAEAVAGRPHLLEHRLPPAAERNLEEVGAALDDGRQVADDEARAPGAVLVRGHVRLDQPRVRLDVVVEEHEQRAARLPRPGVAGRSRAAGTVEDDAPGDERRTTCRLAGLKPGAPTVAVGRAVEHDGDFHPLAWERLGAQRPQRAIEAGGTAPGGDDDRDRRLAGHARASRRPRLVGSRGSSICRRRRRRERK